MNAKIARRFVVDQTTDGKWNVLDLPGDYDLSKGLPAGGKWFDTEQEAIEEIGRMIRASDPPDA